MAVLADGQPQGAATMEVMMARLFTTGFELGEVIEHNGSLNIGSGGSAAAVTSPARTGGYAGRFQGGAIQTYCYFTQVLTGNPQELYVRAAFRHAIETGSDVGIILAFYEQANEHVAIKIRETDLRLVLEVNGSDVDTGALVLSPDTWYVLQVYVKIADSGGAVTVKVNGATDLSHSGDTCAGSNEYTDVVRCGIDGIGLTNVYFDDVAINDTSGTQQTSWVGSGGVYLLKPSADGTTNEWTGSAGGDHYALVDDVPANDGDYVYDSTVGHIDLYALEDLPSEVTDVDLIEPVFQAGLAAAGSNDVEHVVRHSGTNYTGDTETVTTVAPSWGLFKSAPIYEVLGGSGAWTPAQVNALESGVEVA